MSEVLVRLLAMISLLVLLVVPRLRRRRSIENEKHEEELRRCREEAAELEQRMTGGVS